MMVKLVENVPLVETVTSAEIEIPLQLTATDSLTGEGSATVG
jgi:hypothetical protein